MNRFPKKTENGDVHYTDLQNALADFEESYTAFQAAVEDLNGKVDAVRDIANKLGPIMEQLKGAI